MATPKKYFQDHFVLLLLTINGFLALLTAVFILFRLTGSHANGYIVQCRDCSNPTAINKFSSGSVVDLLAFIAFAFVVFIAGTTLSLRAYRLNRHLAVALLSLTILLLILTVIVSNALLVLR